MALGYDFSKCKDNPCKALQNTPTVQSVTFALMQAAQENILEHAAIRNRDDAFKFMQWTMMQALKNESVILKWSSEDKNNNAVHNSHLNFVEAIGLIGVEVYWTR